jgi:hypothetical protein
MPVASVEQIFVGKTSTPQASGPILSFAPPQSFAWLRHFSAEETAEFFFELLDALNHSYFSGNWSAVTEVIETWKATANIKADPTVVSGVEQGMKELAEGQGVGWDELRGELGL